MKELQHPGGTHTTTTTLLSAVPPVEVRSGLLHVWFCVGSRSGELCKEDSFCTFKVGAGSAASDRETSVSVYTETDLMNNGAALMEVLIHFHSSEAQPVCIFSLKLVEFIDKSCLYIFSV